MSELSNIKAIEHLHSEAPEYMAVIKGHDAIITATSLIEERWDLYDSPQIETEIAGTTYSIRLPHLRAGKHGVVAIMEWQTATGDASCVLRRTIGGEGLADAHKYLKRVNVAPMIATYVPRLYGMVGDWAVIERLSGLESQEIIGHMVTSPTYLERYAQQTYALIEKTAQAKVYIDDITFVDGHNVMADPRSGSVKLIEQTALLPGSYQDAQELIVEHLFSEIDTVASRMSYQQHGSNTAELNVQQHYLFSLLKQASQARDLWDLYLRSRVVMPDHPFYRDAWFFQDWKRLSDEEYQHILDDYRNGYPVMAANLGGRGFTEALTPELINAVRSDNFTVFTNLVESGRYKMDITDTSDPRYGSVVLPVPQE